MVGCVTPVRVEAGLNNKPNGRHAPLTAGELLHRWYLAFEVV